jgi:IstB-like ATP binding protein
VSTYNVITLPFVWLITAPDRKHLSSSATKTLIITSNRAFEEWGEIFGNDLLASAALDRLTHHAHTLFIRGDSFRQRSHRKEIAPIKSTSEAPIKPDS